MSTPRIPQVTSFSTHQTMSGPQRSCKRPRALSKEEIKTRLRHEASEQNRKKAKGQQLQQQPRELATYDSRDKENNPFMREERVSSRRTNQNTDSDLTTFKNREKSVEQGATHFRNNIPKLYYIR